MSDYRMFFKPLNIPKSWCPNCCGSGQNDLSQCHACKGTGLRCSKKTIQRKREQK
jgi:DnaJ-class molecular chaperone